MLYDQTLLIHRARLSHGDPYGYRKASLAAHRPWRSRLALHLRELAQRFGPSAASPYRPDASRRTAS